MAKRAMEAVVTLRQDLAVSGANPDTLTTVGRSLVAIKDWTFLLGPGFVVGIGNGLILGYLMYCSGLVPTPDGHARTRRRPADLRLGDRGPVRRLHGRRAAQFIATVPEFAWELSLGIYLTVKGFTPSPITDCTSLPGAAGTTLGPTAGTAPR